MANIQYVGARYVPKVYTNPDDGTSNWKSGAGYEALTIVTYNGDSYTSKIKVPTNIGAPDANIAYWVKTGDYNAQIVNYRQEILNAVSNEATARESADKAIVDGTARHYVFIGDSYLNGYNADGDVRNFVLRMRDMYTTPPEMLRFAVNGAGFTSTQKTFDSIVDDINITNPERITDVIFCGGYNDRTASATEILNAINLSFTKARAKFVNAKMHLIWLALTKNDDVRTTNLVSRASFWARGAGYGATFINGAKWWHDFSSDFGANDDVHPNAQGQADIAKGLYNYINGVQYEIMRNNEQRITYTNNINLTFNSEQIGDLLNIDWEWTNYTGPVTLTSRAWTKIGDVAIKGVFKGSPRPICTETININGALHMVAIRLYNDELQLYNYEASNIDLTSCWLPKVHCTLPILKY